MANVELYPHAVFLPVDLPLPKRDAAAENGDREQRPLDGTIVTSKVRMVEAVDNHAKPQCSALATVVSLFMMLMSAVLVFSILLLTFYCGFPHDQVEACFDPKIR
jgi:hypothetical protein